MHDIHLYAHIISFLFLIQLQKELAAVVKSDLPKDEEVRGTWSNFLEKINQKVEIEASKSNLQKLRDQHEEEKLLYSDKTACKCSLVYMYPVMIKLIRFTSVYICSASTGTSVWT